MPSNFLLLHWVEGLSNLRRSLQLIVILLITCLLILIKLVLVLVVVLLVALLLKRGRSMLLEIIIAISTETGLISTMSHKIHIHAYTGFFCCLLVVVL